MKFLTVIAFTAMSAFAINSPADTFFKDANTTCPVKFIDVFKAPKFIAVLEYEGEKVLFSSPKAMFHYFYEIAPKRHFGRLKRILVSDYKSGDLIEARGAFYVFGSRIVSAGGDDLIPFATLKDAQDFAAANSGRKILKFSEITRRLIEYLEF